MAEKKHAGGRPKIEIKPETWTIAENMAKIHCTGEEIAGCIGISYDTLERRVKQRYKISFAEWYKKFQAEGKRSLRRLQWKRAEEGSDTMLVFLGKQYLGQSDKIDTKSTIEGVTPDKVAREIDDILNEHH